MYNIENTDSQDLFHDESTLEIPKNSLDSKAISRVLDDVINMNLKGFYDRLHNRHNR